MKKQEKPSGVIYPIGFWGDKEEQIKKIKETHEPLDKMREHLHQFLIAHKIPLKLRISIVTLIANQDKESVRSEWHLLMRLQRHEISWTEFFRERYKIFGEGLTNG